MSFLSFWNSYELFSSCIEIFNFMLIFNARWLKNSNLLFWDFGSLKLYSIRSGTEGWLLKFIDKAIEKESKEKYETILLVEAVGCKTQMW